METYTLRHPVTIGEGATARTLTEVALRRPTGKDFRAIGSVRSLEDTQTLARIVQDLGSLTAREFDALDVADVTALVAKAAGFFGERG